jgi:hypothetical protein
MARSCTVCEHADLEAINLALASNESIRGVTRRFFGSTIQEESVRRHKHNHLPAELAKAHEAHEVSHADTLLEQLKQLTADARRIGHKAERDRNYGTALMAVRELVRIVELTAKLRGELQQEGTTNITINAEWVAVRTVLLQALAPYPDARAAVAEALLEVDA